MKLERKVSLCVAEKHIKKLESVVYYIIKRHQPEEGTHKNKRESKSNNLSVQV